MLANFCLFRTFVLMAMVKKYLLEYFLEQYNAQSSESEWWSTSTVLMFVLYWSEQMT